MAMRQILLMGSALMLGSTLGACRNADDRAELADLDDGLAANDPAVKGALGDQIMVDPALTGSANRNAATAGNRPIEGGVPASRGGGTAAQAQADARTAVGGRLMALPAPGRFEDQCSGATCTQPRGVTLGERARAESGGGCNAQLAYGMAWAERMPATFPVYPRAALREAAGVQTGTCNVRVVNFQSRADMNTVLAWYYTRARRAGYSAEHVLRGEEHYLGGTLGGDAFVVIARQLAGGVIDVDIVASGGR